MLYINIDTREKKLSDELLNRDLDEFTDNIEIAVNTLDIGDIYIQTTQFQIIFERKTTQDLLSSINDGRLREQKSRLLSSGINNICYIIEGNNDIISSQLIQHQSKLVGVYLNTLFRDRIPIIFVKSVKETATFLLLLATRLIKNPSRFQKDEIKNEYIDCLKVKSKKIENVDQRVCFQLQLAQIPGISTKLSKILSNIYPNMKAFIEELSEKGISSLIKIEGIGRKKSETILEYLGI